MRKIYMFLAAILLAFTSFGQSPGDIIITEIMQNPNTVADEYGEYFEIYNTTAAPIDINGWSITDNGANAHTIASSLVVPANGYIVLAVNGDNSTNGGINVDYAYGADIGLSNSDDELILTAADGTTEIDRVEWDGGPTFPDPTGISMNLDIDSYTSTANDDGANWCESSVAMASGDFGTPGVTNTSCFACDLALGNVNAFCDAYTDGADTYTATIDFTGGASSTYVITPSVGTVSGDDPSSIAAGTISIINIPEGTDVSVNINNSADGGVCDFTTDIASSVCVASVCTAEGSIIITEIMQNPALVSDAVGEWFEIYNTTSSEIDLKGWNIIDDSNTLFDEGFVIPSTLLIPAGGYLVFACNGDALTNGGLPTPGYAYDYNDLTLGNGADGLTIQCPEGTIIDQVIWDGGTVFPDPSGASMSLDITKLNAVDNDDGLNWSDATLTYGDGDSGTPGAPNDGSSVSVSFIDIQGLSIYPNPIINGEISIRTSTTNTKTVEIFNAVGKRVFLNSFSGTNTKLRINSLNSGIYFIKIKEGTNLSTRKLIVK